MSLNNVVLMGRLTADPELKTSQSGKFVTSFRIAVDRQYTDENGERQADFITCVAWRQTAEFICKYFKKGRMIAIVGSIQSRTYQDQSGQTRFVTEVVVNQASFCGEKSEAGASVARPTGYALNPAAQAVSAPAQSNQMTGRVGFDSSYFAQGSADDFAIIDDSSDLPF